MAPRLSLLFILFFTLSFGQNSSIDGNALYFKPGLIKATATIAPTRFYLINSTAIMLNGYLDCILDEKMSVRGEIFQFLPNLGDASLQSFSLPVNYTGVYAGFGYHLGKRNWKHSLHLEPGITITEVVQNTMNTERLWTINPSYLVKIGTCLYVSRNFHFFAEINYSDSFVRSTPENSITLKQVGISAGLGFQINAINKN